MVIGALAATSPVEATLQFTDWRGVFIGLALLTLLTAVAVFLIVPEKKIEGSGESLQNQLRGIREIFTSRKFWRTAPLATMSQAAFLAIQGLWAGPWLTHVAGFERAEVARLLFWVAVAMIAGFITLGAITERLSRRGVSVATTAVAGMSLFMVVQMLLIFGPTSWCVPVWLAFGFLGTSAYHCLFRPFPVFSGPSIRPGNHRNQSPGFCHRLCWSMGYWRNNRFFYQRGNSSLSKRF